MLTPQRHLQAEYSFLEKLLSGSFLLLLVSHITYQHYDLNYNKNYKVTGTDTLRHWRKRWAILLVSLTSKL